jgi:hypothetical protein
MRGIDHEDPHQVSCSVILLTSPFQAQVSFLAPCSQIPSAYVPPSTAKIHTPTKQHRIYSSVYLSLFIWITKWKTKDSAPNDGKRSLTNLLLIVSRMYIVFTLFYRP